MANNKRKEATSYTSTLQKMLLQFYLKKTSEICDNHIIAL